MSAGLVILGGYGTTLSGSSREGVSCQDATSFGQLYLYPGVLVDSIKIIHTGEYWLVALPRGGQSIYRPTEISRVFENRIDITHRYPELKNATIPSDKFSYEMIIMDSGSKPDYERALSKSGGGALRGGVAGWIIGFLLFEKDANTGGFVGFDEAVSGMYIGAAIGAILAVYIQSDSERELQIQNHQ